MCGISGYIDKANATADPEIIRQMTDAVAHRGPDGQGYLTNANVAFGHRRLAIIDLSPSGHQPMTYAGDKNCSIVFNGEIFNYLELRAELASAGYPFITTSDTEVILAAYTHWGEDCVTRFNGMWSFAILDRKRNVVFCSRDRFGVKPFYYVDDETQFAFGSEIRQLLPLLDQAQPNVSLLTDFILTGTADHTDETFFKHVRKLGPGCNLLFNLESNAFDITRYYHLAVNQAYAHLGEEQAVEEFTQKFSSSIALRLRADVAVATCLSGGLDSSSIATIAAPLYKQKANTAFSAITAVSEMPESDETPYAQQVVAHSHLRWLTVKPSYQDFVETLPAIVEAQEEPFTSPSLTMQYFVMKTARHNTIPVLLDGQGGDETLLGYDKYYAAKLATTMRHEGLPATIRAIFDARRNNSNMTLRRTAMYATAGLFSNLRFAFYRRRHSYLKNAGPMPEHLKAFSKACHNEFDIQHLEISQTNLPLLLRYEDKNSMHHSIEARLPFLDYRFLELAVSLPGTLKIRDGWTKWILRRIMDKLMPTEIVWRKNKLGFESPEGVWLQKHSQAMEQLVFSSPLLKNICNTEQLKKKYGRLDKRSRWRLYSVALWERAFNVQTEVKS